MIPMVYFLGFLWRFKRGAKEEEELIYSFVHLESLRQSIHLFSGEFLAWRRAHLVRREHHQKGGISELRLQ
jgi:hypothetical protein